MQKIVQCEGWWEQHFYGRQPMSPLTLTFTAGNIRGTGNDVVGAFTMTGVLKDGEVVIEKQYVGQHATRYIGQFDGEGSMQGTWSINQQSGRWAIRFCLEQADDQEIKDIRDW